MVPLSVLDLSPITLGSTPRDALLHSLDLARHAERLGYRRFWLAEHHNMPGIASAATAVVICHVAAGTSTIRVGAGGIMLPNHAPMVIAEQFGTLESLFPGRIDLGLGRAPGTDPLALRALRRDPARANDFPHDVQEVQAFLAPVRPGQAVQAVPGGGLEVPLWILGSSTYGARLAAALGLPYAHASHFAPDHLVDALAAYRSTFQPSPELGAPYAMAGLNVVAAETDAEARRLFTTAQQGFANLHRGTPGPYLPPVDDIEQYWTPAEKAAASHMLAYAIVGSPVTVRAGLERFVDATGVDEVMVVSSIYDHAARVRSYEILAEVAGHASAAAAEGGRGS
jgi:luciferase family oxidoreductase group 1